MTMRAAIVAVSLSLVLALAACAPRALPPGASEIEPPQSCGPAIEVPHESFSTPRREQALVERELAAIQAQLKADSSPDARELTAQLLCSGFRCVRFDTPYGVVIRCAWPDRAPWWRRPSPPEQWCVQIEEHEGRMTPYVMFNYEWTRCLP